MTAHPGQADWRDSRLLLLDDADNVLAVMRPMPAGESVLIEGMACVLDRDAGIGFKLARRPIAEGEAIVKYGAAIGIATEAIAAGELVHVHNVASNYLPSTEETGRGATS